MHAPLAKASGSDVQLMREAAWPWLATAVVLAIVLLAPLLVIDVPPLADYPNHLARFFILAHPDDPVLSKIYAPHWTILPNLGMDVIGAGLLRITDTHTGGRILLALSLLAPVGGAVVYHRVAFGCRSYWPLASGLVAYNAAFAPLKQRFAVYLANWEELARNHLIQSPRRSDLILPFLAWSLAQGKSALVLELTGQVLSNNAKDPVGLWFKGMSILQGNTPQNTPMH